MDSTTQIPKARIVAIVLAILIMVLFLERWIESSALHGRVGYLSLAARSYIAKHKAPPNSIADLTREDNEYGDFLRRNTRPGGKYENVTISVSQENGKYIAKTKFPHWSKFPLTFFEELKPGDPQNDP